MLSAKATDGSRTRELIDQMHRPDGFVLLPKKFLAELGMELAVVLSFLVDADYRLGFDPTTGRRNRAEIYFTDGTLRKQFRGAIIAMNPKRKETEETIF
jgi:hypothetical protein